MRFLIKRRRVEKRLLPTVDVQCNVCGHAFERVNGLEVLRRADMTLVSFSPCAPYLCPEGESYAFARLSELH